LVGYLKDQYGDEPEVEKISLPIPSNIAGFGANAVGGPTDFLMISERDGYPLPFEVLGYYDLRHAKAGPYVDFMRSPTATLPNNLAF
jgi:hypothetical protein